MKPPSDDGAEGLCLLLPASARPSLGHIPVTAASCHRDDGGVPAGLDRPAPLPPSLTRTTRPAPPLHPALPRGWWWWGSAGAGGGCCCCWWLAGGGGAAATKEEEGERERPGAVSSRDKEGMTRRTRRRRTRSQPASPFLSHDMLAQEGNNRCLPVCLRRRRRRPSFLNPDAPLSSIHISLLSPPFVFCFVRASCLLCCFCCCKSRGASTSIFLREKLSHRGPKALVVFPVARYCLSLCRD